MAGGGQSALSAVPGLKVSGLPDVLFGLGFTTICTRSIIIVSWKVSSCPDHSSVQLLSFLLYGGCW